nr:hypothetical protein [Tanacetum cinerariifolium]
MPRGMNFYKTACNYKTPSLLLFNFYTSKSDNPISQHQTNSQNAADVTSAELKAQIDKFYKEGNIEAIPNIFESILKRKLSGKHEDSDDELMNEFRVHQPEVNDEDFDSDADSESDSDSD